MCYVEYLRVAKTLRILGYALASLVVLALVSLPFSQHGTHVAMRAGADLIPLNALLAICAGVAALLASILGLTLARENDGHLELAWTKPVSRERYALAVMATDSAGILIAEVMTLATILIVFAIGGGVQYVRADSATPAAVLFGVVFPLSLYAVIAAATASLRRGAAVLAVFWPVALILPTMVNISWLNLGQFARIIDGINPVAYFYAFNTEGGASVMLPIPPREAYEIAALALIGAAGLIASLAQWRRLEA